MAARPWVVQSVTTPSFADTAWSASACWPKPVHVQVDFNELTPIHEQVAAEIRRAIADGEAGPGERLPPARDLAAVLGVNSIRSSGHFVSSETRACWSFGAGEGSPWWVTPPKRAW